MRHRSLSCLLRAAAAAASALLAPLLLLHPAGAQGIDLSNGGPVQVNASGGIDWQQAAQVVIAHGDARAVRGNVTVTADQLIAHYRKKPPAAPAAKNPAAPAAKNPAAPAAKNPAAPAAAKTPAAPAAARTQAGAQSASGMPDDTEGSEVYRLDAVGTVHIFTPTDQAFADKAVYDMDQSVLVLTGRNLRLITPQDVVTATDSMEYWPAEHRAVARGHAVVLTNDGRRIGGDILVAYTSPGQGNPAPPANSAANMGPPPGKPPADPLLASGKLQRVEAFGNVDVRTATETVHGDRGVYVPDTGRAHLVGRVRVTRGQNQLNGSAALVNMKTGVATMLSGSQERVAGLIVPNDAQTQGRPTPTKPTQAKPTQAKPTQAKPTQAKPASRQMQGKAAPGRGEGGDE